MRKLLMGISIYMGLTLGGVDAPFTGLTQQAFAAASSASSAPAGKEKETEIDEETDPKDKKPGWFKRRLISAKKRYIGAKDSLGLGKKVDTGVDIDVKNTGPNARALLEALQDGDLKRHGSFVRRMCLKQPATIKTVTFTLLEQDKDKLTSNDMFYLATFCPRLLQDSETVLVKNDHNFTYAHKDTKKYFYTPDKSDLVRLSDAQHAKLIGVALDKIYEHFKQEAQDRYGDGDSLKQKFRAKLSGATIGGWTNSVRDNIKKLVTRVKKLAPKALKDFSPETKWTYAFGSNVRTEAQSRFNKLSAKAQAQLLLDALKYLASVEALDSSTEDKKWVKNALSTQLPLILGTLSIVSPGFKARFKTDKTDVWKDITHMIESAQKKDTFSLPADTFKL